MGEDREKEKNDKGNYFNNNFNFIFLFRFYILLHLSRLHSPLTILRYICM